MNRRSFFEQLAFRQNSFAEQQQQAGLEPYTGTWATPQVCHLLRRATFGIRASDIATLQGLGMATAVDLLLTPPANVSQPINYYMAGVGLGVDGVVPLSDVWVDKLVSGDVNPEIGRMESVKLWLLERMRLHSPTVFDKMTLFWHNHFAVEELHIYPANANDLYHYFNTIDQHALGNFKALTRAITLNPAMLYYLNGVWNNAVAPDENYARELQELFTIGKGVDAHFTEDDVKAAARVLTGYRVNQIGTHSFYFDPAAHDTANKQFSAFYNNTVIQGGTAAYGAASPPELDALLDMIFAQAEVAKFICRKIYRFFIYHDITPSIETNIIVPLSNIFRDNNYNILPVLQTLFKSAHFYESLNYACLIKSPIDFVIGLCREFNIAFWTGTSNAWVVNTQQMLAANAYRCADKLLFETKYENMHVANPPSVSGWQAYYQAPMYNRHWINTDTYGKRMEWVYRLCHDGISTGGLWWSSPGSWTLKINLIGFAQSLSNPADPNVLVQDALVRLYSYPVEQDFKDYLKSFLLSGQTSDYYWSDAWADYIAEPNNLTYKNIVESRLRDLLSFMLTQAEYQLF
jgi:uncharacterized protein (DUF1800 family)